MIENKPIFSYFFKIIKKSVKPFSEDVEHILFSVGSFLLVQLNEDCIVERTWAF